MSDREDPVATPACGDPGCTLFHGLDVERFRAKWAPGTRGNDALRYLADDYTFSFDRDLPVPDDPAPPSRGEVPTAGVVFRPLHTGLPRDRSVIPEPLERQMRDWIAAETKRQMWERIHAQMEHLSLLETPVRVNEMTGGPE